MRNLRNLWFGRWRHQDITSVCWDSEKDDILCTVGPTSQSSRIELVRVSEGHDISHVTVANWDAPSPSPDLMVDKVVNLQYLSGTGTACLVLEGGDIVTVQEDIGGGGAQIEIMGSIDDGIAAAAWSPDQELLVIVTKANSVLFMGSTFDPVAEMSMTVDDLRASKHVSVGWGKKETQFQGRGAKAMRDPTIPERVDSGLPSSYEDGKVTVSWRGDGAFVAINAVQEGERRVIRVYSREGELDGASEPVDGMESTLSWRPAGNLLASVQRIGTERVDVVFFERNGLRHGQFTLRSPESSTPVPEQKRICLEWNTDSTVLAVVLDNLVQLWTMGNYHWYLKQEIPMDPDFVSLSWHPEKALRFAAASSDTVISAENVFYTARGSTRMPHDNGAVAVIDGDVVKLTPYRGANVPPPMALFDLALESAAVDVAFGRRNQTIAVLHHKGVDIFDWVRNPTDGRFLKPELKAKVPFETYNIPEYHVALRLCCSSIGEFHCMNYQDGLGYLQLGVSLGEDRVQRMTLLDDHHTLVATATYEDDNEDAVEGYAQDRSGKLYRLSHNGNQLLHMQFRILLPLFEIAKVDGELVAFGLSRNGHLYANSKLLAKNCTSFILTPSHLIFTTNNHLIKFVHLNSDAEGLEVPEDDPEIDERCRSVERGSRIVTAIPTNMSVILQMPRGNLETIFPRAMVVAGIRSLIEEKNYGRAFSYCRTQRVDMNILYDHKPQQFLENVGLFLDQLKEISNIDLFLSGLREEDVTQTMYKDTKRSKKEVATTAALPSGPEFSLTDTAKPTLSKVNTVCDSLLKALQPRKARHLQNIITAHVCKDPPALEDGLSLVAELRREDEKLAENAVEHICFLVDVNRLYDHALGLYNLDLALLVAQQSQRDPREYLPFMQKLHELPELRRKFEIDDHLGRQKKALLHLQSLDAFDELCAYASKNLLYGDALRLYRYDQARHNTIMGLYAAYLESKSAYREAGLAYESLHNFTKAMSCYRATGATCWQECLFAAQQQIPPPSADAMNELSTTLAEALWEAKDYAAAATIHLDHLDSLEAAVRCLCKGYHFAEAMRLVVQRNRADLLISAVDVGLAEALGSTTEFLADCRSQLGAQVPRVAELRRKAAEDPLSFFEGERAGGGDVPDDVSVAASSRLGAGTSASLFTRYTGKGSGVSAGTLGTGVSRATSKNRRREEKKRARGRKGTVYEEEYLVNSLRRLVDRVTGAKPEVERLVFALARRGMPERARSAEALMADVVAACERAVQAVFPQAQAQAQAPNGSESPQNDAAWAPATGGGEAVFHEFVRSQGLDVAPPVVAKFEKLSLLGA